MIVRRLVSRRAVRKGSTEEEPKRKRAARFLAVMVTTGFFTGIAAWLNIWPFGNAEALVNAVFGSGTVQVAAQSVFPPVGTVHKVVDVYDTPPPTSRPTEPPESHDSDGSHESGGDD